MKCHHNVSIYDSLNWNWSRSCVCNDDTLITCCIDHGFEEDILWRNAQDQHHLASLDQNFPDCMGLIDVTLVEDKKAVEECITLQVVLW